MSTLINLARKGNKDAMLSLYNSNKKRVFLLCSLLTDDTNTACNAASRAFRNMWDLLIAGGIATEAEFSAIVLDKAVNQCKANVMKKDSKAFRVPVNKNFVNTKLTAVEIKNSEPIFLYILRNLPPINRFVYVLSAIFGYDENGLARTFKMNRSTVSLALSSEEINVKRLVALSGQSISEEYSLDKFHCELENSEYLTDFPDSLNTAVLTEIESVCAPIIEKARQYRNKILRYISIAVLSALLVGYAIYGIFYYEDDRTELDGTEDITDSEDTDTEGNEDADTEGDEDAESSGDEEGTDETEESTDSEDEGSSEGDSDGDGTSEDESETENTDTEDDSSSVE